MKNFISKKRIIPSSLMSMALCLLFFTACNTEGVKLNANDRFAIDTISANAIKKLTVELDKQCRDSADVLRKQLVDSLVAVREREIIMQTLPPNH